MDTLARHVCMAAGSELGGEGNISTLLGDYFASETADSANPKVVRFSQFMRADRTMDLLRREAGTKMRMGAAFPATLVSALRMQNAPPRPIGKIAGVRQCSGELGDSLQLPDK